MDVWILHKIPGVQEKCTQVIYLKDQLIRSHADPYVMYRTDTGYYISTATRTSTSYCLTPFLYLHFYTYMFFYILHLLYLHFNIYFS
jgi:hypothetical protein